MCKYVYLLYLFYMLLCAKHVITETYLDSERVTKPHLLKQIIYNDLLESIDFS